MWYVGAEGHVLSLSPWTICVVYLYVHAQCDVVSGYCLATEAVGGYTGRSK